MAEIVGIIVYFVSPVFIAAFNNDPKVIAFAKEAHIITLFYFLFAFSHCIAGLMRGVKSYGCPCLLCWGCWCVIRVTYITIAVKLHPVIQTVLGLSTDLVIKLHSVFDFLSEIRLDPWF